MQLTFLEIEGIQGMKLVKVILLSSSAHRAIALVNLAAALHAAGSRVEETLRTSYYFHQSDNRCWVGVAAIPGSRG